MIQSPVTNSRYQAVWSVRVSQSNREAGVGGWGVTGKRSTIKREGQKVMKNKTGRFVFFFLVFFVLFLGMTRPSLTPIRPNPSNLSLFLATRSRDARLRRAWRHQVCSGGQLAPAAAEGRHQRAGQAASELWCLVRSRWHRQRPGLQHPQSSGSEREQRVRRAQRRPSAQHRLLRDGVPQGELEIRWGPRRGPVWRGELEVFIYFIFIYFRFSVF